MNLNSIDCEVFDSNGYFAIKDSELTDENSTTMTFSATIQGNRTKKDIEEYLSDEHGKTVVIEQE